MSMMRSATRVELAQKIGALTRRIRIPSFVLRSGSDWMAPQPAFSPGILPRASTVTWLDRSVMPKMEIAIAASSP